MSKFTGFMFTEGGLTTVKKKVSKISEFMRTGPQIIIGLKYHWIITSKQFSAKNSVLQQ